MQNYDNILEIRDLCVHVGGKLLLNHLNLTIPKGEVHALLGQNGSGKTSLMMTIMGFSGYDISHGQILYKGVDLSEYDVCERARLGIALAQQRPPTIKGVKLRHVLEYTLAKQNDSNNKMLSLASTAHMNEFLERSIDDGLSGGEIKRSELLQLLAMNPDFSMMDEPDSGVDIEALSIVGELINQLYTVDPLHKAIRKSGIIITHSGNILNYLHIDKAHIMHNGTIGCSGHPDIIIQTIQEKGYEECVQCMKGRSIHDENI
jgi:Fe-S cluster assembly ATP-binding protein